jgi:aspartate/methionine/tyrosine aminotransferase
MEIEPFLIERWYERYEFTTELMLSSSDCESWTVADLLALEPDAAGRFHALRLGYTETRGAPGLRAAVASSTDTCSADDVTIVAAAEEAIFVAMHALLRPGDHVVVEIPCYASALTVARSTGAEVSEWTRRFEDGWAHDLDLLASLLRPETRLVYVNSPHNPTGTQLAAKTQSAIIELARERGIVLFSDEVYRGLEHDTATRLPQAADLYERALSLGAPSKALGLPGLRLGWLVSRDPGLHAAIVDLKLYTTICSSAPSEFLTELALMHHDRLLERNRGLVLGNLPLVEEMLARNADSLQWIRPTAGPIGFPRLTGVADTEPLCEALAAEQSVLLLPGSVYGLPNHVRIGFGRTAITEALARFEKFLGGRLLS